jgi:hypothetical protein
MAYDGWPKIHLQCPVCFRAGCAIYRGYYSRFLFCTELEVTGRIVHRTGFCKSTKTRFSFIPDFVLPRRRISRFTHDRLREARVATASTILAAIDELTSDLGEEFFLPISTAHIYLHLILDRPP